MIRFDELFRALSSAGVEYILVGGLAAAAHGSSRFTQDIDIVYRRSAENHRRIAKSLIGFSPYLRGAPQGLPFRLDEVTLQKGLNFTLSTSAGDLDLLGEIIGGGRYEDLLPHSIQIEFQGIQCRCLGLEKLIAVKRATARAKDLDALAELELIASERQRDKDS